MSQEYDPDDPLYRLWCSALDAGGALEKGEYDEDAYQRHQVSAIERARKALLGPPESSEPNGSGVPNRDHLKGKQVRLTLNPWATSGPTEGTFNGQGERGLSIIVAGGGRYTYSHHEVAAVELA